MNKAKRDSEIQNCISYLLSRDINEEQANLAIQLICNKYYKNEVKKLKLRLSVKCCDTCLNNPNAPYIPEVCDSCTEKYINYESNL